MANSGLLPQVFRAKKCQYRKAVFNVFLCHFGRYENGVLYDGEKMVQNRKTFQSYSL
jgi:hypothetical protein